MNHSKKLNKPKKLNHSKKLNKPQKLNHSKKLSKPQKLNHSKKLSKPKKLNHSKKLNKPQKLNHSTLNNSTSVKPTIQHSTLNIQHSYSGLYPKLSSSRFELRQSLSTLTYVSR